MTLSPTSTLHHINLFQFICWRLIKTKINQWASPRAVSCKYIKRRSLARPAAHSVHPFLSFVPQYPPHRHRRSLLLEPARKGSVLLIVKSPIWSLLVCVCRTWRTVNWIEKLKCLLSLHYILMSFRWQNVVLVINFSSCLSSLPQPQPLAGWCCSFVVVFGVVVVVVAVAFVALLAKAKHSPTFAHTTAI